MKLIDKYVRSAERGSRTGNGVWASVEAAFILLFGVLAVKDTMEGDWWVLEIDLFVIGISVPRFLVEGREWVRKGRTA